MNSRLWPIRFECMYKYEMRIIMEKQRNGSKRTENQQQFQDRIQRNLYLSYMSSHIIYRKCHVWMITNHSYRFASESVICIIFI